MTIYVAKTDAFIFAQYFCFLIIFHKTLNDASLDRQEQFKLAFEAALDDRYSAQFSKCPFVRFRTRRAAPRPLERNFKV